MVKFMSWENAYKIKLKKICLHRCCCVAHDESGTHSKLVPLARQTSNSSRSPMVYYTWYRYKCLLSCLGEYIKFEIHLKDLFHVGARVENKNKPWRTFFAGTSGQSGGTWALAGHVVAGIPQRAVTPVLAVLAVQTKGTSCTAIIQTRSKTNYGSTQVNRRLQNTHNQRADDWDCHC